ncbi:MAG: prepilin-type N-terminal cleavage/methylation domain-containing protein [Candidatus Riflebacteria bacterium]|nr:prepilin-type N-terminal cleavage/methylation domain-containing protein [Candidatus Riflebacteria bacterium]
MIKRPGIKRVGFTLVELMITTVIISLISLVLIVISRSNLATWKWGQQHMEFNQKIQLAMKQVFTDIKNVNPLLEMDEKENLLFKGEKGGEFFPNLIEIGDTDGDLTNGGEVLTLTHSTFTNVGDYSKIRLFLEPGDTSDKYKGALMREIEDRNGKKGKMVIYDRVSDLHFQINEQDIKEIRVSMVITDDTNPLLKENLSFAVSLDTDLVCVKFRSLH